MRLLNTSSLVLEDFAEDQAPPYAILSHTWGVDEMTLGEMRNPKPASRSTQGFEKVRNFCMTAYRKGLHYAYIDTCCIDKTSSAELAEAFNLNFRRFQRAKISFVHLSDVQLPDDPRSESSQFVKSRWFTRGWPLQELLAPKNLLFFDRNWNEIDNRQNLRDIISRITGINARFLGEVPVSEAGVAERMSWTTHRMTARIEDRAYCLLGIFDVYMLPLYGEGFQAFTRLAEALMQISGQNWSSLLAWKNCGPLHVAAGKCDLELMDFLLRGGADPNSQDLYGRAPIHHAAEKGQLAAVTRLLEWGAKAGAQDPGGETALHLASRKGYQDIVLFLLKEGTDASVTTSSGQTAKQLANNPVIKQIFDAPPVVDRKIQREASHQIVQAAPSDPTDEQRAVCTGKSAYVTYYSPDKLWPSREIGVYDLIYTATLETELPRSDGFSRSSTRWIHLPLNNITWIMHLIERLHSTNQREERYCNRIKEFVTRNLYDRVSQRKEFRFRQPHFKREQTFPRSVSDSELPVFSMVMPYFDMESKRSFDEHQTGRMQLLSGYPELQLSPSLDQSYYLGLIDTNARDADQVLTKMLDHLLAGNQEVDQEVTLPFEQITNAATAETGASGTHAEENPVKQPKSEDCLERTSIDEEEADQSRLLMVPQLWLWIIDERTIITACPERLHKGDRSTNETLFKSLQRGLNSIHAQSGGMSLERFMAFAVQNCITFFDDPSNSGLDEPAALMFARYIAIQSEKEVKFRRSFLRSLEERASGKGLSLPPLDIRNEIKCLHEVKDIRDEINMIDHVLQYQSEVFNQMASFLKRRLEKLDNSGTTSIASKQEVHELEEALNLLAYDQTISVFCRRWKRLDEDAQKVEKSLNHLLDLKQKQANLDEAAAASEEAKIAGIQNQAVLVFTVVTVIFTPLSFVTSLYALDYFKPADGEFQARSGGWDQNDIGRALGVGEGVTIAVLAAIIAYAMMASRSKSKPLQSQVASQQPGNEEIQEIVQQSVQAQEKAITHVYWRGHQAPK